MATSLPLTGLSVSWWGTVLTTIDAAINDKIADQEKGWFSPANCSGGCDEANIFILDENGRFLEELALRHP